MLPPQLLRNTAWCARCNVPGPEQNLLLKLRMSSYHDLFLTAAGVGRIQCTNALPFSHANVHLAALCGCCAGRLLSVRSGRRGLVRRPVEDGNRERLLTAFSGPLARELLLRHRLGRVALGRSRAAPGL